MAWNTELPDEAKAGDTGHVADHNLIVAAISEVRTEVDKKGTSNLAIGTTATTALAGNTAIPAAYTDAKAQAAIKGKSQIAALTETSTIADVVAALKA